MSAVSVQPPFPIFSDSTGLALDNGKIYLGEINLDAEAYPETVYWDKELTIPAAQPIRTIGGYPSRAGTAARIYVNGDCSIKVKDQNDVLIYSSGTLTDLYGVNQLNIDPPKTYDTMAEMIADYQTFADGDDIYLVSFHSGIYTGIYYKVSTTGSLNTHNGGTIIDPTNTAYLATWDATQRTIWFTAGTGTGVLLTAVYSGPINPLWFGAKGDGTTDDYDSIEASISVVRPNGGKVLFPQTNNPYVHGSTIFYDADDVYLEAESQGVQLKYTGTGTGIAGRASYSSADRDWET